MDIGDKIYRLTLIDKPFIKNKHTHGLFRCDCGNIKEIRLSSINSGVTRSCGCYAKEQQSQANTTHGMWNTKIYWVWHGMIERCENSNRNNYNNYGGRGIKVCDDWIKDFNLFFNWAIENGWQEGLQIDRINNDGNYEPNNCQIITHSENNAIGKKRKQKNCTSNFIGVHWNKGNSSWRSQIIINKKKIDLGCFDNEADAVEARINAEVEYLGEQKTNFHYNNGLI